MTIAAEFAVAGQDFKSAAFDARHDLGGNRLFVARWEHDLSRLQSLIEEVAAGAPPPTNWVDIVLHGTRIADLDERAALVVGASLTRSEMIGQPVAWFTPPDSRTTLAELILAVATDRPLHALRSRAINSFMLRDARLKVWGRPSETNLSRINVAVEGILADDRSPWALRASEQRYRKLIHHLPNALLQVDATQVHDVFQKLRADGVADLASYLDDHEELVETADQIVRVTDANDGAVKLFRAKDAAALARPVGYVFASARDCHRRVMIAAFEGKRSLSELIKLRTFDGEIRDVQLSFTFPNLPERLDVTLISLEDVTDRLRTESQLRQLQADYSRATRIATLGELASSIAHEVNQPLAAIAMNADTSLRLLSRDEPNLPKVAQLTERIATSARHASDIVQRIRGMASRNAPERLLIDLNVIVDEALLFVRHCLEDKAIKLSIDFEEGLPKVRGDRVQLQQVIINLLVNGLQALDEKPGGGGSIKLATGMDEDGATFLEIRDNGPGIPSENLDRIFEGFFTTKEDGMGIGLSVCQTIIVSHGGRISASNHGDGGAMFRFSLPAGTEMSSE